MPKGSLSREQFSQLLLVYISIAADIVEIFEAFRESRVMLNQNLTYVVLAVWTWSLLQFCVVLRGTHRGRKARISSLYPGGGEYPRILNRPKMCLFPNKWTITSFLNLKNCPKRSLLEIKVLN